MYTKTQTQLILISIIKLLLIKVVLSDEKCTNGNRLIQTVKISNNLASNITKIHNYYRLKVSQGEVWQQPQGRNLFRLYYDHQLARSARKASLNCDMKMVDITDPRWYHVGQNMYLEYSNVPTPTQNWDAVIAAWFEEHHHYSFPDDKTKYITVSRATAHYTQLVWAKSRNVGCDFVVFYEYDRKGTPYGKLYTCFYGPGGNVLGEKPYEVGTSSDCLQLC